MSNFFEIQSGNMVVIIVTAVVIGIFIYNLRRIKMFSVKALTYSAICIAVATVLSYIKVFKMPQGGSVTACSMLFISLVGYFFGAGAGILAGIAHGLLQLIIDPYVVHPAQLLMDYILAFGAIGLSGLFYKKKYGLEIGVVVGMLARFVMSALSGYIFFGEYVPQGDNPVIYTIVYNISYIAPEIIITLIIISLPPVKKLIGRVKATLSNVDNVVYK